MFLAHACYLSTHVLRPQSCLYLTHCLAGMQATRAYLHAEADVEAALEKAGFRVVRKEMTATSFYFSRMFEAVRV